EVVRAVQRDGGLPHALVIERPMDTGGAVHGESGARAAIQDEVTIGTRLGRIARMKVHRYRADPGNTDIGWQLGVGTQQPGAHATLGVSIKVRYLPARVHASVRAPGANECDGLCRNTAERSLRNLLHAGRRLLSLPAGVRSPEVLDAYSNSC